MEEVDLRLDVAATTAEASSPARHSQRQAAQKPVKDSPGSYTSCTTHPPSCFPASHSLALTLSLAPFPHTSCDVASCRMVLSDRRLAKRRASSRWHRCISALAASVFPPLHGLGFLTAPSRVLCLAVGAGHAVDALRSTRVVDVIGTDLVDFPPLVHCVDPHRLPFSNAAFDLVFSDDPSAISSAEGEGPCGVEQRREEGRRGGRRVVGSRGKIIFS
uniref:Methyltransferase type 11 domain-containing protein n=1 Tax=Setaria italica TaxID=4555 RepID=K3Y0W5_SETIT